jgi:His-Xaa-Ser system protein HxsD
VGVLDNKEIIQNVKLVDNLEINSEKNFIVASINPKIYSLDVVYAAAYSFIEKCYVAIDGDPNGQILVKLTPFNGKIDHEQLGKEINNELVQFAASKMQDELEANIKKLRER